MMTTKVLEAPFLQEITELCSTIYNIGWGENHAGNLSYRLTEEEVELYIDKTREAIKEYRLAAPCPKLEHQLFLVTASGSPFKHMIKDPEKHLGVIQISEGGTGFKVIWGFRDDRQPTSELPTHLLCHHERQQVDKNNRIV